jgi:hypothetical protein
MVCFAWIAWGLSLNEGIGARPLLLILIAAPAFTPCMAGILPSSCAKTDSENTNIISAMANHLVQFIL